MALFLREAGPPDAPGLVFLHGLWLSSAMWLPQMERLSTEYHCLAPDLPEHGQSTDIGLLTLSNTSLLVANLIREHIPTGRAHIVGLSLGGLVALGVLCDVPEVIDHLMVSGCGTQAGFGPVIRAAVKLGRPLLRVLKPAPLLRLGLRLSGMKGPSLQALQADLSRLQPEAILHFAQEFITMTVPQAVKTPTLVAVGQKEDVLMKRAARELGRTLGAQMTMMPDLGHVWNLQAPDLFTQTLQCFLTDQPLPQSLVVER